ncbi:glycosyl hydrolase [bacterium]|nr:glycosyl hydrolase [bacterium]
MEKLALLVGTRKGAFIYTSDFSRKSWKVSEIHFLGSIINHLVLDPRDNKTLMMAAKTGHLGPTVFCSTDFGKTWKEAEKPPAFPKVPEGKKGLKVDHTFWLTPGHKSQPNVWYAGTSPQGLFKSVDSGKTWEGVRGFNENPMYFKWTGEGQDGTPDGSKMHSILVNPNNAKHLYIAMSGGGVFESLDEGESWKPLNKGVKIDFLPEGEYEFGQDPHSVKYHPLNPELLYQQNHCGIYKLQRPNDTWERIGDNMPREIKDIGFTVVLHPKNTEKVWVFPMDGTDVWPRTSIKGKPAVYCSENGGKTWQRQDKGLPKENAWFTVKRQCFTSDNCEKPGLYFGTTSGEIWASFDEGENWEQLFAHLPHIYSVETGIFKD